MQTKTWTPSPEQIKFVKALLEERVPEGERANWLHHLRQVESVSRLDEAVRALKKLPYLPEHARPSQAGLYRNPETGVLYRLTYKDWNWYVAEYSKVAKTKGLRLTKDGKVVNVKKGKWTRYNSWQSRGMIFKMRASWLMSEKDMHEYQYGICLYCYRGLEDARSVIHMYGPKCAKDRGLPWNELPEGTKIVEEK